MSIKEKVDNYLITNFESIEKQRTQESDFRWITISLKISKKENISPNYIRDRFLKLRKKQNFQVQVLNPTKGQKDKFPFLNSKEDKFTGTKEFTFTADNIPSEDEIISHFNIDTTKWFISQIYHKTSFGGKYAITVNQRAKVGLNSLDPIKEFEKFVEKNNLKILTKDIKTKTSEFHNELDCTVVINLADLHLGKLVSEAETGERYNIEIAKERFLDCIKYFARKSFQCYGVKRFILSTLGDTLHTDTLKSTTTAGTYVESDTRASKTFQTALDILTESIDILKEYAPEIEFINIAGNHCELSEQHLGIALQAYYRKDKQVSINSEPKNRKYKMVGENLLTWNHGDTNMNTLPLTVATEVPELWGKSKFRLIQLGHFHSTKKRVFQSEDEFNGVIVRHFSSLSGTDFWHDKNNFKGSQKRGTALVFSDNEIGIIGELYKTV
ncbi:MAG: hypothetical protein E6R13_06845 [Spirochaetes bacterium]|nr:MAG: hypothetical protein E6R13_06845 [Spirochaetota bacterium]